jgi:tetraacyldisaccharide 4'-kinase
MIFKKPKFWDYKNPNFIAYLLLPLSYLLSIYNILTFKKKKIDKIKTICVGNIYVGGTGKTPLSIEINKILNNLNYKTCFIKKEYSDQIDEQKLLKSNGKLFCGKDRTIAAHEAIKENFEVAIFDDGLQDKNIKYDISIVCFNEKIGIGNGFLLPSGPLRESLKSLNKYDVIFLNGNDLNKSNFETRIKEEFSNLNIFKSTYSITNLHELNINEKYLVFAGIGNFDNFTDMLKKNNFKVVNAILYPDHYNYSNSDIKKIKDMAKFSEAKIITTEKDYLRITDENKKEINVVKIELKIKNKDQFNDFLNKKL